MIVLRHPATGHEVRTDAASADFWSVAGYQNVAPKAPAKKPVSRKKSGK